MLKELHVDNLKVALFQTDIIWEDPAANFADIERMAEGMSDFADLIVLPETFNTGFSMNLEKITDEGYEAVTWMQRFSKKTGAGISGTVIVKEGNQYFNRHYFVMPKGTVAQYDKRHLFGIGGEREFFKRGRSRQIINIGGFRIMLQTCYDLRFPVFSRFRGDYDVIIYAANWPGARQHVWETLIRARAIENQAYVIGINRSGRDGEGLDYLGGSCLIDPSGNAVAIMDHQAAHQIVGMDIKEVSSLRKKYPVYADADNFSIDGVKF